MVNRPSQPALSWQDYFSTQAEVCRDESLRRFYATGLPDPQTPLQEVAFAALDFETTGMDPERHAIVSIGLVPFGLERIRPAQGLYRVVRPSSELSARSVTIHRITHDEVAGAPGIDSVLDEVLQALAGRIAVVHYRNIERPFMDRVCQQLRGEACLFPLVDTMAIEAYWSRQGLWSRLKRWLGGTPPSIRLAESRARYGLPFYSSHHAKVDALATAELFLAQVARHYTPETPISDLWL